MTLPFVEKYRPTKFKDIIYHDHILNVFDNFINQNKLPHVILYGPAGTGKTTTALAIAKKMYGGDVNKMILELNGSDDRGIQTVREQIKDFCTTQAIITDNSNDCLNKIKLVILDEVDSMTPDAQFALRRIMEKYTYNTRFCLICNYMTKIIPALQSRCMFFRFEPIPKKNILKRLSYISKREQLNIDQSTLKTIVSICNGDMRKCLNILQSMTTGSYNINKDDVYELNGYAKPKIIKKIIKNLIDKKKTIKHNYEFIYEQIHNNNLSLTDIIDQITDNIFDYDISDDKLKDILIGLAKIQYHLNNNGTEKIQLYSLISYLK